jgi:hypothetical protein
MNKVERVVYDMGWQGNSFMIVLVCAGISNA